MPDPEIKIQIRSTADNKGFDSGRESAGKFKEAMGDLRREFPLLGRALEVLKNPIILLIGLFAGLAEGIKKSFDEFSKAEVQSGRLDAALKRSGQLTDDYRSQLHELAGQMQELTGIADDAWAEVIRKLTQFGATKANVVELTNGVKNLAGIMDGDLAGAADLLGRALQGNFEVLSRYGIKSKEMTGLLQELAVKGEGQLEAQAKTLIGTWQNLKNQIGDLFEGFGGLISRGGLLKSSIDFVAGAFQYWVEVIGDVQDKLPGLTNDVEASAEAQKAAADATRQNAEQVKALEAALTEVNAQYDKQKALLDSLKENGQRELDARREYEIAQANASGLSGAALEARKYAIEQRHTADSRALRDRVAQGEVRAEFDKATGLGQAQADIERSISDLTSKLGAAQIQDRINERIQAMRQELDAFDAARVQDYTVVNGIRYAAGPVHAQADTPYVRHLRQALGTQQEVPTTTAEIQAQIAALQARLPAAAQAAGAAFTSYQTTFDTTFRRDRSNQRVDLYQDAAANANERATFQGLRKSAADEVIKDAQQRGQAVPGGQAVIESQAKVNAEVERVFRELIKQNSDLNNRLKNLRDGR